MFRYLSENSVLDIPPEQLELETVRNITSLAENEYISQDELPDGTSLIEDNGNILWTLFLYTNHAENPKINSNGVDLWSQIDSIRLIAGDENDGCWEIIQTDVYTSPGNQGSAPSAEQLEKRLFVRLIKTAGGDYMCFNSNRDISFGLIPSNSAPVDLSKNDAYHYFTPSDYSGENWKYMNVTRLSPKEAADYLYESELYEKYASAEGFIYNAKVGYTLDKQNGVYMMYDGIWNDDNKWVYRFWIFKTDCNNISDINGTIETIEYCDVDFYAYEK